jgi:hypothetical protein
MTRSASIIKFIGELDTMAVGVPAGISLLNPYRDSPFIRETSRLFYEKFYHDEKPRTLMLGINPGRFGAGMTGIPFTDPKRLVSACGLPYEGKVTHEPSSGFIYDMIDAYGGTGAFYGDVYINSLFPLTVIKQVTNGKVKNYNYYDDTELLNRLRPFIVQNIKKQIELTSAGDTCICLGTGRNADVLRKLNEEHHFFSRIIALEHPRFIVQYKNKERAAYIDKYLRVLAEVRLSGNAQITD